MTRSFGRNLAIFLFAIAILLAASESRGGDLSVPSVGADSVQRLREARDSLAPIPGSRLSMLSSTDSPS